VFPVGEFMEPAVGGFGKSYQQLRHNLARQQTPLRQLSAGDSFSLSDGVTMTVHSPRKPGPGGLVKFQNEMELNEESLVFSISHGQVTILFTADAGFPAEQRMLSDRRGLKSTILKVGHHGSRYSTSQPFLEAVRPQAALISAGYGNSFGLPSPDTVAQLVKKGIRTYRTDKDGTIELVSDGTSWNIQTDFASGRVKLFDLRSQIR
jgi:competence protein ComEC